MLKNNARAAQAGAAAFVLGQSARNVGLLLCPEFTYRRNELWLLEHSITKQLCSAGISLDKSFTLQFQNKVDARDHLRPLNYRGRFLEGVSAKIKEKEFLWKNAPLWKDGRTDLAQQMCTKDMVSIESVLEDANGQPMDTPESEEFGFSGARKIEQIGQNACEKLLQGMMKD